MSDVKLDSPGFSDDALEECPPTERDPSARPTPPRGVALSVLWWVEEDTDHAAAE